MDRYIHGGDIYSRNIKLDFSSNINPLGMPDAALKALTSNIGMLEVYPDVNCTELVECISGFENVDPKNIFCSNGAADIIYRIVHAFHPKKALLTAPSFSEYAHALEMVGCKIEYEMLSEENDFELTECVLDKINSADIFFLGNPNNPDGKTVKPELLKRICKKCSEKNVLLIIDECFMDFVKGNEYKTAKIYLDSGVIVLKAFTKFYAMAGLRLGYVICSDVDIIRKIKETGPCWSVSSAAQLAGKAVFSDLDYYEKTRKYVWNERDYLSSSLEKLRFRVFSSEANFILFKSEYELEKELEKVKIAVRNCENYIGLNGNFFRTAVKKHEQNEMLINALERIVANG